MDTGDIAIVVTLVIGFVTILITQISFVRGDVREFRSEVRKQTEHLGQRVSECELEQARLKGVNETLNGVLRQQSHTHEASAD